MIAMLHSFIIDTHLQIAIKSGFYIDFFYKKLCEVFIRNILIVAAYIIGEKFMIEFITKLTLDKFIILLSTLYSQPKEDKYKLFYQIATHTIYAIVVLLFSYIIYF